MHGHFIWKLVIIYIVTFGTVRVLGKKQVATMTFWDVVSAIALGSLAASAIFTRDTSIWQDLIAILGWGAVTLATDWAVLKSRGFRRVFQGRPAILIANGQLQESVMRRERMNIDLLRGELRAMGAFTLEEVEWAIIEPNGKVTVLKRAQDQTPTRSDLKLPGQPVGPSVAVVVEGEVSLQTLHELGLGKEWLEGELAKAGVTNLQEIFYADRNPDGSLHIQKRTEQTTPLTTLG